MLSILYRIIYPYGIGFFVFFFLTLLFQKQKAWRILWIVLMTGCVLCCCYFSMDLIKNDPVQTSAIFVDAHRGSMELTYWDLTFQNEQDGKFNLSYPSKYVSEFEPFIQYRLQYAKRTHMLLSYSTAEDVDSAQSEEKGKD